MAEPGHPAYAEALTPGARPRPRRRIAGNGVFFPLATAYAVFVLPASVLSLLGATTAFPGLSLPAGHAHEMLFGFALAVVAGNQLGPLPQSRLALLAGLWAGARAAMLFSPASAVAIVANVAFALLLAAHIAPRLLGAAKKWRNKALPWVLLAICASSAGFQVAGRIGIVDGSHAVLMPAVLLFGLLLLFMGGRIIAPAVAGQFYRQGGNLAARVQPRIEAGLIVSMAFAIAVIAFGQSGAMKALAGAAIVAAGLLAALRMWRWQLWALRARPDLLCLAAGYGWLAIGLVLLGAAIIAERNMATALHVITIGSLGTLTLNVMATSWVLKARAGPARQAGLRVGATALVGVATLARVLADFAVLDPRFLLLIAATAWSCAFGLLLLIFALVRTEPHARRVDSGG